MRKEINMSKLLILITAIFCNFEIKSTDVADNEPIVAAFLQDSDVDREINKPSEGSAFIEAFNTLSQGVGDFVYGRTTVIESLTKVAPVNYSAFIEACNTLSKGMDGENRSYVIYALAKVDPVNYSAFIEACNTLSKGINVDNNHRRLLVEALAKVDPVNYDAFKEFIEKCNTLSQGMDDNNRINMIYYLTYVARVNYDAFIKAYKDICNDKNRTTVGRALTLTKVDAVHYEKFVKACNTLSESMDGENLRCVIYALAKVAPVNYDAFIKACEDICNDKNRTTVVQALTKVDAVHYEKFVKACNTLSQGVDDKNGSRLWPRDLRSLTKVDAVHYEEFVKTCNTLSQGMDDENRTAVIKSISILPQNLWTIMLQYDGPFKKVSPDEFLNSIRNNPIKTEAQLKQALIESDQGLVKK